MHTQEFNLQLSRQYLLLLLVIYLCSACIVVLLPSYLIIKLGILLVLTVYLGWVVWQFCLLKSSTSIVALRFIDGNRWVLMTRQGDKEADLLGDSTMTRFVSVMRFQENGSKVVRSCILFSDTLGQEEYRRLIVIARSAS